MLKNIYVVRFFSAFAHLWFVQFEQEIGLWVDYSSELLDMFFESLHHNIWGHYFKFAFILRSVYHYYIIYNPNIPKYFRFRSIGVSEDIVSW